MLSSAQLRAWPGAETNAKIAPKKTRKRGLSENLFDHVICGGGSAGSVLAARLSEDPSRRVCLVEAGPDTPPEAVPADIRLSYHGHAVYNPDFLWRGLKVTLPHRPHNRPEPQPKPRSYEQARVMGGGSSINGQLGNRGVPSDYDDWSREGAEGWSWAEVLPFFRKLETDLDFGETPLHGGGGPIPVRRIPREAWPGYSQAAAATWQASGLPYLADQNGDFRDGWFALTTANAAADHRVSAAMGYLTAAVRARPNLTILARHLVLGLDFDAQGRATAVRLRAPDGDTRRLEVRRDIILSMGAIRSPAFLQSQGIGAPEDFSPHGIALRNHRPGVGRNLQEHPTMGMAALLPAASRMPGALTQRNIHVGVRWSSGLPGIAGGDMFALAIARPSWHAVGARLGAIQAWVNRSYSQGSVRIQGADPALHPEVNLNLLSDARDAERLMDALRRIALWHAMPALRGAIRYAFPAVYNEAVRKVAVRGLKNDVMTRLLAPILELPGAVHRAAIHAFITEAPPIAALLADEDKLEAFVRANATGQWHVSCTCRMGREDDPMAVTDSAGRVHGTPGLRVCDASVFPFVPSANTNFPTLMVAEKMAAAILAEK